MKRFIESKDRKQVTLLPECLDDFVAEDNPVRIIEAFVEELDLESLGFDGAMPSTTVRPSYHPAVLLKIYIYARIRCVRRHKGRLALVRAHMGARSPFRTTQLSLC